MTSGPRRASPLSDLNRLDAVTALVRVRISRATLGEPEELRLRLGLRALLETLDAYPELVWTWLAVWRVNATAGIGARRAAIDEALASALPLPVGVGRQVVQAGWWIVHQRLWRYAEPRLVEIEDAVLALVALRARGVGAAAPVLAPA